jgi:hypothetical protein
MYLLKFLSRNSGDTGLVNVEYRLACSGQFCNRRVSIHGDYRKSDASRVLLKSPLELFVVGHPFDAYPQELCLRFSLDSVSEPEGTGLESGTSTVIFLPDEHIVEDFCSTMTLLSRRLVSPIVKVRERRADDGSRTHDALGSYGSECPIPVLNPPDAPVWKPRPVTTITNSEGLKIVDNNPPLVGVDPWALSEFLIQFPNLPKADQVVYAARLYRTALETIELRPDIAYLLLVSTVETLANVAYEDYEPSEPEKLEARVPLRNCAQQMGLTTEQTKQLILADCKSEKWTTKKFKKFLLDFTPLHELEVDDRVFIVPSFLCPQKDDIPEALRLIYKARSDNVHVGSPFPRSIRLGTTSGIDIRALPPNWPSGGRPEIPPVTWFERVVWLAASHFVLQKSGIKSIPCVSD